MSFKMGFDKSKKLPDWTAANLTASDIIAACIDGIVKNEYDDYCIFEYGLTKILSSHRLKEVGADCMQQFLATLLDHVSKLLSGHQHSSDAYYLEELLNLVTKIKEFLICLKDLFEQTHIRTVYIAVEMTSRINEQIFLFLEKTSFSRELSQSKEISIGTSNSNQILFGSKTLQHVIIQIIADNLQHFICNDTTYIPDITRMLKCLCSVGEFPALMDVKLTSEIWKCISRLSTEYSNFFKENHGDFSWLEQPVKYLCEEISQSVAIIFGEYNEVSASDQFTSTKLERILKMNSFYLKVVIKFATDYEHQYFQGCKYVIKLWILLNCCPENIEKQDAVQINQYLTVGMMNIIQLIYKNEVFIQALSDVDIHNLTTFRSYLRISSEIMDLIIGGNDVSIANGYFLRNGDKTMVDKIFENILIYNDPLLKKEIYENLITKLAAIFISTSSIPEILKYFETNLIQGILQDNISLGFICYDIWCIVFRFASPETRLQYFRFCLKFIINRPIFSITSNAVFIDVLLKTLYTILSENQKEIIWRENENSDENITKLSFVLGIESTPNRNTKERMISKCITNLESNLSVLLEEPSKESYYEVAKNLQLLSIENVEIQPNLAEKIESAYMQLAHCKLSHSSLLVSLICFAQKHNSVKITSNVLHDLSANMFNGNIKFYVLKLICVKNIKTEMISKIINSKSAESKLFLIYCTYYLLNDIPIRYATTNQSDIQIDVIKRNYFQVLDTLNIKHVCIKSDELDRIDNFDSHPSKRLKRDHSNILLAGATQNVQKIQKIFETREPDEAEIAQIAEIVNIFSKIIRNKSCNKFLQNKY